MLKEAAKVCQFSKTNKVEINFDNGEICIWGSVGSVELTCQNVKPEKIQVIVDSLVNCRKHGWTNP